MKLTRLNSYSELCERAKRNGFKIGLSYPDSDGLQILTVKNKYVEYTRIKIKSEELDMTANIIIETMEEMKLWTL